jgi:hypothetical protein
MAFSWHMPGQTSISKICCCGSEQAWNEAPEYLELQCVHVLFSLILLAVTPEFSACDFFDQTLFSKCRLQL